MLKFQRLAGVAIGATLLFALLQGGVIMLITHIRKQQVERANEALQKQAVAEKLARQLTESRLKLLQAQVEPHFLFNTLASVQELAEARAPEAAALIAELITFLRGGLIGLRDEATTLEREFDMARAYLSIMKIRMGDRLQFYLTLPEELATTSVPPAMVISLVENAIKHGVEPALGGGTITLAAFSEAKHLAICVTDTGVGFAGDLNANLNANFNANPNANASPNRRANPSGRGLGLSNIHERLAVQFGDAASLNTTNAKSGTGFIATLRLPHLDHVARDVRVTCP